MINWILTLEVVFSNLLIRYETHCALFAFTVYMFYVNTLQKFMQDYVFSPRGKNNTQHMKKHRPDSSFLDT